MILYFSATGNGKYIAEQIAAETDDKAISIVDCIREGKYLFKDEKILGVITPTYFWRLPRIVTEFLEKLTIENCRYTFLLVSYGTSTGQIGTMAKEILKRKGQKFDAYYSVIMPDTWTPIFNLSNKERVERWLNKGKAQLKTVIEDIKSNRRGDFIKNKLPKFVAALPSAFMYTAERKTKTLSVNKDLCIGCKLCEKKCPVEAIIMEGDHPVWKDEECEMCLGCLHRCPKFAISYGSGRSNKHGQYKNPYTKI